MISNDLSVPLQLVPCDVCQHDIPISEAVAAEMTDYVVYFCGLDCYDRWRRQRETIHFPLRPSVRGRCRVQIIGKVEFRQGEGILFAIPLGAADVEVTALDTTFSWTEGNFHAVAAMPFVDFCRYITEGAIDLDECLGISTNRSM